MSKWKDSKSGDYYRLFLDRDTKAEEATMYRKIVDGVERYTYMTSIGSSMYCSVPLSATNVTDAKLELIKELIIKNREHIDRMTRSIKTHESIIKELESNF